METEKSGKGPPPVLPLKGALSILHSCHSQCSAAHAQRGFLQGLAASGLLPLGGGGGGGGGGPLSSPIRRLLIAYALPQPHEPPYPPLLITLIAMKPLGHIAMYNNLKSPTYRKNGGPVTYLSDKYVYIYIYMYISIFSRVYYIYTMYVHMGSIPYTRSRKALLTYFTLGIPQNGAPDPP